MSALFGSSPSGAGMLSTSSQKDPPTFRGLTAPSGGILLNSGSRQASPSPLSKSTGHTRRASELPPSSSYKQAYLQPVHGPGRITAPEFDLATARKLIGRSDSASSVGSSTSSDDVNGSKRDSKARIRFAPLPDPRKYRDEFGYYDDDYPDGDTSRRGSEGSINTTEPAAATPGQLTPSTSFSSAITNPDDPSGPEAQGELTPRNGAQRKESTSSVTRKLLGGLLGKKPKASQQGSTGIPVRRVSSTGGINYTGRTTGSMFTSKEDRRRSLVDQALEGTDLRRVRSGPSSASPSGQRARYPPVAQGRGRRSRTTSAEPVEEPDFVEWGFGGVGSAPAFTASAAERARERSASVGSGTPSQPKAVSAFQADDAFVSGEDDDGSGMAWVRKRRQRQKEAEEQARAERSRSTSRDESPFGSRVARPGADSNEELFQMDDDTGTRTPPRTADAPPIVVSPPRESATLHKAISSPTSDDETIKIAAQVPVARQADEEDDAGADDDREEEDDLTTEEKEEEDRLTEAARKTTASAKTEIFSKHKPAPDERRRIAS
ncbi:hypothetical protein E5Q_03405 [Mixia osmundae IAM 14324]|uniref:Uncharacterized protein n=2 Tax=Mixia osmundae (strain CBS 9802 / IAM 14324 / JCM 22182 / KY 12970) TaxID=764103 RepID=G7E1M4_MIXOS|nr:hypothetical protein E5Q_03405 [Mixia osmundae IAM 14324]